jgi:diguanylate cyclase (GGDEF)-like protein
VNGETLIRFEEEVVLPSGKRMFCLISATPYFDSHGKLKGIMEDITDISQRKVLEDELLRRSTTDELTGLFNRRGFFEMAERELLMAKRSKDPIALFFVDLDNMKAINDGLGHEEGDKALVETARILRNAFRKTDILCRLGGDEFVIMAVKAGLDLYAALLRRVETLVEEYNASREPNSFELAMSLGSVYYDPDRHNHLEDLLAEADSLMYKIKQEKHRNHA